MFVYRFRHSDGSLRWVEDHRRLSDSERGGSRETVGFLVDITERKHAEDKRKESEELFRVLLESSPDAVLLMDRDFRYLYANPEAARILNTPVGEIVGKSVSEVLPADAVDRAMAFARGLQPGMRSSLAYDLSQGNRLEVETLAGSVVRYGRDAGVAAPLNFVIYACLKPHHEKALVARQDSV